MTSFALHRPLSVPPSVRRLHYAVGRELCPYHYSMRALGKERVKMENAVQSCSYRHLARASVSAKISPTFPTSTGSVPMHCNNNYDAEAKGIPDSPFARCTWFLAFYLPRSLPGSDPIRQSLRRVAHSDSLGNGLLGPLPPPLLRSSSASSSSSYPTRPPWPPPHKQFISSAFPPPLPPSLSPSIPCNT